MKAAFLGLCFLACMPSAFAADTGRSSFPDWMLGNWTVTKVYEADIVYPQADAEPVVRLSGKTMSVEPNKLSLSGEICLDLDIKEKKATVAQVLKESSAQKPKDVGLSPKKGPMTYFDVRCRRSFMDQTTERTGINYIEWYIVFDEKDQSAIQLAFLGGTYLELHRASPTS